MNRTDTEDIGGGSDFSTDDTNAETAYAEIRRANNLAFSGHFDDAIAQMSDAITRLPTDLRLRLSRAKLYVQTGQLDRAKDDARAAAAGSYGTDVQFEVEALLMKLGLYELVAKTASQFLLTRTGAQVNRPALEYFLAYSQERLGRPEDALQNYLNAANEFMIAGASLAADHCLKRANIVTKLTAKYRTTYELKALERPTTGLSQLKEMVARLVSDPNCFDASTLQTITGLTMAKKPDGTYWAIRPTTPAIPVLTPLNGVRYATMTDIFPSVRGKRLGIQMDPSKCCLVMADLDGMLKNCPLDSDYFPPNGQWKTLTAYKVASGTLIFTTQQDGFSGITHIMLSSGEPRPAQTNPQNVPLNQQAAARLLQNGKVDEALAYSKTEIEKSAKDISANYFRATVLAKAKRYKEAIETMRYAMDLAKHSDKRDRWITSWDGNKPLIQVAEFELESGEYLQALADLKEAFPDRLGPDQYYLRARAETGAGQLQDACADLALAEKQYFDQARIVKRDEVSALLQKTRAQMHPNKSHDQVNAFPTEAVKPETDQKAVARRDTYRAAIASYMHGDCARAESLYQKALQLAEDTAGLNAPSVADCLENLAEVYRHQGKFAAAEPFYERAMQIRVKTHGANYPNLPRELTALADDYYFQGKYVKAEPLYKQSLNIIEKDFGPQKVAIALRELANLYMAQEKYADAEPLFKKALTINEKRLPGEDATGTGNILAEQAVDLKSLQELYKAQGKQTEWDAIHKSALAIADNNLNANRHDQLALVYFVQGNYAKAEPLYKEIFELFDKRMGANDPSLAMALDNLAACYQAEGKYAEAEPLYQRSLQIYKNSWGTNHPAAANARRHYIELLRATNRKEEADKLEAGAQTRLMHNSDLQNK